MNKTYPQAVVDQFEDFAYKQYETSRVMTAMTNNGERVQAKLSRKDFTERAADGSYKLASTSLMWLGWKLCLEAQAPILESASRWSQWAECQDRVDEQIPTGYTVALCMEKDGFYVGLTGPDDETVEYEDPADLNSPMSVVRIVDSALAAAKADHAKTLN